MALALVGLAASASGLRGQALVSRSQGQGEVGLQFVGTWRGAADRPAGMDGSYRQWLRLPLRGSLLDDRLVRYSLTLNPALSRRLSDGLPEPLRTRDLGLDFSAVLFPTHRISFNLGSSRATGTTAGGFGASGDFAMSTTTAIMNVRNSYLPLRLSYVATARENSWLGSEGGTPIAWANDTRTLRFSARNSKLNAVVEKLEFDDRLLEGDFEVVNARVDHTLRWGKGSWFESAFDRSDRRGDLMSLREAWSERLHLQHTKGTGTDYYYRRSRSRGNGSGRGSEIRSYGGSLSSRVASWLSVGGRVAGRTSSFQGGREDVLAVSPSATLSLKLPLESRFVGSASWGFEWREREAGDGALVDVVDERHAVDESRSFLLERSGVDIESVVLRSSEGDILYESELDYRLVELDGFVQVIALTGGRIEEGAVVLVSYRYTPALGAPGNAATGRYSASLSSKGFTLRHSRSLRDARAGDEGTTVGIGAFDESETSLEGQLETALGRWNVDLRMRDRRSSAIDFTAYEADSHLTLPRWGGLQLAVGAVSRWTTDDEGALRTRSAYTTIRLPTIAGVRVGGRLQAWDIDVNGIDDESLGGDLDIDFRIASVWTVVRYRYNRRTTPPYPTVGRLSVRIVRRF